MAMYLSLSLAASDRYPKRNVPRVDYASIDKPEPNPADDRFIRKSPSLRSFDIDQLHFDMFSSFLQDSATRTGQTRVKARLQNCTSQTRSSVKRRFYSVK